MEVCVRCKKNWWACSCPSTLEWEGDNDQSVEDEDDFETNSDFDADELGDDPEYEGE